MKETSRREFIRVATAAAGAFAGLQLLGCTPSAPRPPVEDPAKLPSLGGAPDTDQGRTIAAFVDTIVPGKHRDPTGAVGGLDVNAPSLFFDPELPALKFVPLLVLILDGAATKTFNRPFIELVPDERDQVVTSALAATSQLEFAVQLVQLAYLSSDGAAQHLGYPGANAGYLTDANFSFNSKLTTELTTDGNLD